MGTVKIFKILVIDDDPTVVESIRRMLSVEGYQLDFALNGHEALEKYQSNYRKYALVILDYLLPDFNGASVAGRILTINPDQLIVMLSGDKSRDALKSSFQSGAVDFIEKGISAKEFRTLVANYCKKYEESIEPLLSDESPNKNEELIRSTGMVGRSDELARVASFIHQAAKSHCPVLITGESGTGKELVAQAIHKLSSRKDKPFVVTNMGATSTELFESHMFGHMKGSFTSAFSDQLGKFKQAHTGTIFLDEIGDLGLDRQVKLLRTIQEGEIQVIGGKIEKVNVRVVAATNRNLETEIKFGRFREDLFYRLNVLSIEMPPLRARPEDIIPLILHFERKYNKGKEKVILMEAVKKLQKYMWPGNIRELENELRKIFEATPDEKISLKHLSAKLFEESEVFDKKIKNLSYEEFKDHLKNLEIKFIEKKIKKFKSIRDAAADGLKIPASTLFSRMKSLRMNSNAEEK